MDAGADEAEALRELEGEPYDPPDGHRPCFRLWHYPAGGDWRSWTLFLGPDDDGLVRETGWNRRENSVWTAEARLPADLVDSLRRRAHRVGVMPQLGEKPDWAEFGIEGWDGSATPERLYWSGAVPGEFRVLAAWYSRTRALFEEKLDAL